MNYDAMMTDDGITMHRPECNCPECHKWHVESEMVEENARLFPKDFQCCVDHLLENLRT